MDISDISTCTRHASLTAFANQKIQEIVVADMAPRSELMCLMHPKSSKSEGVGVSQEILAFLATQLERKKSNDAVIGCVSVKQRSKHCKG